MAGIFVVKNKTEEVIKTPEVDSSNIPTTGKYCFSRSQRATADAPYSVEEHVVFNFAGVKVTGTKIGTMKNGSYMVDGYEGTLEGSTISNGDKKEMELTYTYTIEGSKNRELEVYAFFNKNLVKKRWVLKEAKINGESILVPDYVGEPKLIMYEFEQCSS